MRSWNASPQEFTQTEHKHCINVQLAQLNAGQTPAEGTSYRPFVIMQTASAASIKCVGTVGGRTATIIGQFALVDGTWALKGWKQE